MTEQRRSDLMECHSRFLGALGDREAAAQAWRNFAETCRRDFESGSARATLAWILHELDRAFPQPRRFELAIFDHGCGGALTLLYLLAIGYQNIWGVEVDRPKVRQRFELLNAFLKSEIGFEDDRFRYYDKTTLPFNDESFDVILSQQVREQVSDNAIVTYYSEQARVLRKGGIVWHEVPHRLEPYDSHTHTWCIHMLPRRLQKPLFAMTAQDPDYVMEMLWRRWPSTHRAYLRKHFDFYRDITLDRFMNTGMKAGEFNASKIKRGRVYRLISSDALRWFAPSFLRPLMMMTTISTKL